MESLGNHENIGNDKSKGCQDLGGMHQGKNKVRLGRPF